MIDGETHYIGTYANEDDAGIDYARAVFKYEVGKVNAPRKRGQQNAIDLTDVPPINRLLKNIVIYKDPEKSEQKIYLELFDD